MLRGTSPGAGAPLSGRPENHLRPVATSDSSPSLSRSIAPGRGVALIVASGAFFTISDAITKWLRTDFPVGEVIALRSLTSGLILFALIPLLGGWSTLRVRHWRNQGLRAALVILTTVCFIAALPYMPLSSVLAIAFAGPIFTVILVGPLLGESVGWRRWTAVGIGFAGVLLMVQPGGQTFQAAAVLPLGTAVFGALRDIITRKMSVGDHSNATLTVSMWATAAVGFLSYFAEAIFPSQAWATPDLLQLGLFALSGLFMGAGQYCIIESLRVAEASLVVPFKYVSYLWAVLLGFAVWGDTPRVIELAGVSLIIGSGLFIFWRERALRRGA